MSYYGQDQQWHQHSQTTTYNTTTPTYQAPQANGGTQGGQRTGPIGPVLNQAVNNIVTDLKSNIDKEYFKTTCGLLSIIETIASLTIFIIASNIHTHPFLTLLTGFAFWISLVFLLVNLFAIPEKIIVVPWTKVQMGFCAIAAALLFLETLIIFFTSSLILALLVLHLAALFGYHAYDKLKEYGRILNERTQQQTNPQQSANLNV